LGPQAGPPDAAGSERQRHALQGGITLPLMPAACRSARAAAHANTGPFGGWIAGDTRAAAVAAQS